MFRKSDLESRVERLEQQGAVIADALKALSDAVKKLGQAVEKALLAKVL